MSEFPAHLFDEPDPDVDTLANLGPLTFMAGIFEGENGFDVKPTADGAEGQAYIERRSLQPIDPQMNGPQLLYGLRYHTHIVNPDDIETYHDQVGYWLWEPATGDIFHTLSIPRAQVALAKGNAGANDRKFTVEARRGSPEAGICSGPFLEENFRTDSFIMTVTIHDENSWSYSENTVLKIAGVEEPFSHSDKHKLRRVAAPTPNPLARGIKAEDWRTTLAG
ncbi:MAG: FABP family protein [Sphingomonadaceae bacterium]